MRLEDFDFELPPSQIAQFPAVERDQSRLLILDRQTGHLEHADFRHILNFLNPPDCLVVNETKVRRARLGGHKVDTGGRVELLLLSREAADGHWLAMATSYRSLRPGSSLELCGGAIRAEIVEKVAAGRVRVRIWRRDSNSRASLTEGEAEILLEEFGDVPLPPYIHRAPDEGDLSRYQTVYARKSGAVAAPTAGLHFSNELLDQIEAAGIAVHKLTLHVGPGTFEPMRTSDPRDHKLEPEYYEIDADTAAALNEHRRGGGRVIGVGTTVVRSLETVVSRDGVISSGCGLTSQFIYPPFQFRAVDALVTNFHLPRSSLLLLVAAFAGQQRIKRAYGEAVAHGYRFYSYGDAMFIQ